MWQGTAVGTFVDKHYQPTTREILASIGAKKELWNSLERFVEENYRTKRGFVFYGGNYGWALRFRKAGKALLSMYPGQGSFTVQIVVGGTPAMKASSLKLGRNVRNVLENAHEFPEGRWLFIRVRSKRDLHDVQQLLLVKERPKTSLGSRAV
jgi:hypothetical protein